MAATVSPGEETRLAANPDVAEVVPDQIIHLATPFTRPRRRSRPDRTPVPGTCPAPSAPPLLSPRLSRPCTPTRPTRTRRRPGRSASTAPASLSPSSPTASTSTTPTSSGPTAATSSSTTRTSPGGHRRPDRRRRGVHRLQLDRRPGQPDLRRQQLQRPAAEPAVLHQGRGRRPGRQPGRADRLHRRTRVQLDHSCRPSTTPSASTTSTSSTSRSATTPSPTTRPASTSSSRPTTRRPPPARPSPYRAVTPASPTPPARPPTTRTSSASGPRPPTSCDSQVGYGGFQFPGVTGS